MLGLGFVRVARGTAHTATVSVCQKCVEKIKIYRIILTSVLCLSRTAGEFDKIIYADHPRHSLFFALGSIRLDWYIFTTVIFSAYMRMLDR